MSISVTIAMYCLLQIYVVVSAELAPHKPLLKLVSVKAVGQWYCPNVVESAKENLLVFLTFWQATFLSLLSMVGVIKDVRLPSCTPANSFTACNLDRIHDCGGHYHWNWRCHRDFWDDVGPTFKPLFIHCTFYSKVIFTPPYTCLHLQTIPRNRHQSRSRLSSDSDFSVEITRARDGFPRNISWDLDRLCVHVRQDTRQRAQARFRSKEDSSLRRCIRQITSFSRAKPKFLAFAISETQWQEGKIRGSSSSGYANWNQARSFGDGGRSSPASWFE